MPILPRPRIARRRDGTIQLNLPPAERELLRTLPAELRRLLDETPDDPSLRRLFPRAYEDEADEDDYRRLMGDELASGRRRTLEAIEQTADAATLDPDTAQAWLTALNDLRLVLGTRLDVREDTLLGEIEPAQALAREYALYAYLSWLQERLVEALSAGLPAQDPGGRASS